MSGGRTVRLRLGRSFEDGPGALAWAVSLLLHGLAGVALLLAASRPAETPPWPSAAVRLVGSLPEPPRALVPLPGVVPPEPEPELRPEPPAEPPAEPALRPPASPPIGVAERREPPRREPPEPPRKPAPAPPPEPKPEPKPEPEPEPEPPARPPPVEPPPPSRTVRQGAAAARFEGSEVPHDAYLGSVVRRVSGQWLKPRAGLPPRPARVYFEIGRDGRPARVRLEESSGSALFDRAALRAVDLADPLPPLPPAYPHERLRVHFDFIP